MPFIEFIQALLALLIIFGILLQHRSSGLSASMGGTGVAQVQRRGAEKVLYQGTALLCVLFFVLTIVRWFLA